MSEPDDIQDKLNSMGCETSRPFTVNIDFEGESAVVCCVSNALTLTPARKVSISRKSSLPK